VGFVDVDTGVAAGDEGDAVPVQLLDRLSPGPHSCLRCQGRPGEDRHQPGWRWAGEHAQGRANHHTLPRERLDDLWGRLGAGFGEERAVLDAIRAGGEGLSSTK
jgi:hypothetical protein